MIKAGALNFKSLTRLSPFFLDIIRSDYDTRNRMMADIGVEGKVDVQLNCASWKFEGVCMPRLKPLSGESSAPNDTRTQLIDAAERLFAEEGIEAVSLRSIGLAAQQANKVAVQYHFIDKRSLVAAIFERRAPGIEARVSELVETLIGANDRPHLDLLVTALFMPLVESGGDEPNVYARFLLNLLCSRSYWSASNVSLARLMFGMEPVGSSATTHIVRLIDEALPDIPRTVLRQRLCSVTRMLLGAIVNRENMLAAGHAVWPLDLLIDDQFTMIVGALSRQPRDHFTGLEAAAGLMA
jgi:AcrR family transcriptional regulator